MSMDSVEGKVGFVSGGASGIGLAMAKVFGHAGMKLVVGDIHRESLARAERELGEAGVDCLCLNLDVTSEASWARARAAAIQKFGAVHVLVNNAGMVQGRRGMADLAPELWRRIIDVNLTGVFLGVHTFGADLIAQRCGHIVNTSSIYGLMSAAGTGSYVASKFAVVGLSEALWAEMAPHGVGVSVLCPGFTQSALRQTTLAQLSGVLSREALPFADAPARSDKGMDPENVAKRVLKAIASGDLYIVSHPEYRSFVEKRCNAVLASFGESAQPGYRDPADFMASGVNPAYERL